MLWNHLYAPFYSIVHNAQCRRKIHLFRPGIEGSIRQETQTAPNTFLAERDVLTGMLINRDLQTETEV